MNNKFYDIAFNESLSFYQYELYCSVDNREIANCTEEFFNQGFLKILYGINTQNTYISAKAALISNTI